MACVMSLATYWRMRDLGVGEVGTGDLQQPPPPNLRAPHHLPQVFLLESQGGEPCPHPTLNLQDQLKQLKPVRSWPRAFGGLEGWGQRWERGWRKTKPSSLETVCSLNGCWKSEAFVLQAEKGKRREERQPRGGKVPCRHLSTGKEGMHLLASAGPLGSQWPDLGFRGAPSRDRFSAPPLTSRRRLGRSEPQPPHL